MHRKIPQFFFPATRLSSTYLTTLRHHLRIQFMLRLLKTLLTSFSFLIVSVWSSIILLLIRTESVSLWRYTQDENRKQDELRRAFLTSLCATHTMPRRKNLFFCLRHNKSEATFGHFHCTQDNNTDLPKRLAIFTSALKQFALTAKETLLK